MNPASFRWLWTPTCLLAAILSRTATPRAECPPPTLVDAALRKNGDVAVQWVHPQYLADTVRAWSAPYDHPFFVSMDYTNNRVAFQLDVPAGGAVLATLGAYFLAASGTSPILWSEHAAFSWTVRSDSAGVPGPQLYPAVSWSLGDSLYSGGWQRGETAWWLPDSVGPYVWLVGRWPDDANAIVRMGSDNSTAVLPTVVGYSDLAGTQWQPLAGPGLLVDVIMLSPGPMVSAADAPATTGFRVVRDLLSGPLSPRSDTSAVVPAPVTWSDSAAYIGQTIRYRVLFSCDTSTGASAWSDSVAVTDPWGIDITPRALSPVLPPETEMDTAVVFHNDSPESLYACNRPAVLSLAELPTLTVDVAPDSFLLPPLDSQVVTYHISTSGAAVGLHEGWSVTTLCGSADGRRRRLAVPLRVRVDLTTGVAGDGSSPAGEDHPGRLEVTPLENPFGDALVLQLSGLRWLENTASDPGIGNPGGDAAIEVRVYDILGRLQKRAAFPPSALAVSGRGEAVVRLAGTSGWATGVYICRVRLYNRFGTAKLLHIR